MKSKIAIFTLAAALAAPSAALWASAGDATQAGPGATTTPQKTSKKGGHKHHHHKKTQPSTTSSTAGTK
jgi:hypothetical protein